jgi:hypothetical protein
VEFEKGNEMLKSVCAPRRASLREDRCQVRWHGVGEMSGGANRLDVAERRSMARRNNINIGTQQWIRWWRCIYGGVGPNCDVSYAGPRRWTK